MHVISHYNESGDLRAGAFWEFEVPFLLDELQLDELFPPWHSSPPIPPIWGRKIRERLWAEVVEKKLGRIIRNCSLNSTHALRAYGKVSADLNCTGDGIAGFAPAPASDVIVLTDRVRESLIASELRGCSFTRLSVLCCQPFDLDNLSLWTLGFDGANCYREYVTTAPVPNECPFCGFGPIVCPDCQAIEYRCPNCTKKTTVAEESHGGPSDLRFAMGPPPSAGLILEGHLWEGEDFLPSPTTGFVSSRVVRWLLDKDFCPFVAWPARMDVSGMSKDQLAAFDDLLAIDLAAEQD